MDKVKPIILKYEDGRNYTLEFSRASVVFAEQRGFNIGDIGTRPMTAIPELFWYAFRMHHPSITKQQSDKILFDDLGGLTEEVLERLGELYDAPFGTLIDTSEGDEKNATAKMLL